MSEFRNQAVVLLFIKEIAMIEIRPILAEGKSTLEESLAFKMKFTAMPLNCHLV